MFYTPGIGDLRFYSLEKLEELVKEKLDSKLVTVGAEVKKLYNFCHVMRKGDYVLLLDDNEAHILIADGEYNFVNIWLGEEFDVHARKLTYVKKVSREELSVELRTAFRVKNQLAKIDKHYDEIVALSKGEKFVSTASRQKKQETSVVYPLRGDYSIEFNIPVDMTKEEAKRLCEFFRTLYFIEGSHNDSVSKVVELSRNPERTVESFSMENKVRAEELKQLCNGRMSRKTMDEITRRILNEAKVLDHNSDMMMWYYDKPSNMPADTRVDLVYMPTYMAVAFLIKVYLLHPGVVEEYPNFKEILIKGMLGATGRQFRGPAYDGGKYLRKTLRIFDRAGVGQFIYYNKDWCPEFTKLIHECGLGVE